MWAEAALKASTDGGPLSQLPTGTVTFLLSDDEGSTRLWSEHPGVMPKAVSEVYAIFDEAVARHEGVRPVEQGEGDSVVAAFSRASDSLAAALEVQRALHKIVGGRDGAARTDLPPTAEAQLRDAGNYFGIALAVRADSRDRSRRPHTLSHATHDLVADCLRPMASSCSIAASTACATSVARSASLRSYIRSFTRLSPRCCGRWTRSRTTSQASCRALLVATESWRN